MDKMNKDCYTCRYQNYQMNKHLCCLCYGAGLWKPKEKEDKFFDELKCEIERARIKHPGNELLMVALMEEVGELAQALVDESKERIYEEALHVATVAVRIAVEGDATIERIRYQSQCVD